MAEYAVYTSAVSGTTITKSTPANGDTFTNDGNTVLIVESSNGSTVTFDVVTTQTVETDLDVEDRTESIATGTTEVYGPFSIEIYGTTITLQNWSSTTNVTIYALKVR